MRLRASLVWIPERPRGHQDHAVTRASRRQALRLTSLSLRIDNCTKRTAFGSNFSEKLSF